MDENAYMYDYNNKFMLQETTLTGSKYTEYFKFHVHQFEREVVLNLTFLCIEQATPDYSSVYDGYLGIQPY